MLLPVALLALAQSTASSALEKPGAEKTPHSGECLAVVVTSPQLPTPPERPIFSTTRILDLEFRAILGDVEGPHTLELKLYTPRGHLYQVLSVPFTTERPPMNNEGTTAPRTRWVSGHARPLEEQPAAPVRFKGGRRHRVRATLPVAGTLITSSSLYGRWRVEPHLDGDLRPCGPPHRFAIQP